MECLWVMVKYAFGNRCTHVWKYEYQKKFKCYVMSDDAYDLRKMSLEEVKLKLALRGVDKIWESKNENILFAPYCIDFQDFEREMEAEEI